MAGASLPQTTLLAGRGREQDLLARLLAQAAAGEAQTMVVLGAAGVGKTALVRDATARRVGTLVLTGACLPLMGVTVAHLGLRMSLRGIDPALEPPDLDALATHAPGVVVGFDSWISALAQTRPVVLVVDDLQWADIGTLDALTYLVAGPAARRLAVIGTVRRAEAGTPRGRVPRWLADVRRLPRTTEIGLEPLDRDGTADQIALLHGELPHQTLIDDVHHRTGGNPYLTSIIVAGLAPDARRLPDELASDLRSALLAAWAAAPEQMRELATVLAIGGWPMGPEPLAAVSGRPLAEVVELLGGALDRGLLETAPGGAVWHPHPLAAEVLVDALSATDRARLHAAFADELEGQGAAETARGAARIADHRARSGDRVVALEWALRAATAAEDAQAHAEAMRLLHRASRLAEAEDDEGLTGILVRLQAAASRAGMLERELEALERLLERVSRDAEPLFAAELLVRRMHLRFSTGRGFLAPSEAAEAMLAASADPRSGAYAFALAEVAHAGLWAADPGAPAHAARAVAIARDAGDDRALAYALAASAMAQVVAENGAAARELGAEGAAAALRARDWWGYVHASLWEANAVETWASTAYAGLLRDRRENLVAHGAPHAYIGWLAAGEAASWFAAGSWHECGRRLRDVFASDPGPSADAQARLIAARLAVWQGRQREAEQHLARADELFEAASDFLPFDFDAVRAEVRLGAQDWAGAYDAAMAGALSAGVPPTMCEWLMPLAARALANQAEWTRDRVGSLGQPELDAATAALEALHDRFPDIILDVGESTPLIEQQTRALAALYAAELDRGLDPAGRSAPWREAADALRAGELPWEAAYARWREADSLLVREHDRARGAAATRDALDLAVRLGAQPLVDRLTALAHHARVSVRHAPSPERIGEIGAGRALTPREREVMALVLAGRTYAEIARELVISEKTVSTHISHLLAKTGTANRLELAALAERVQRPPA